MADRDESKFIKALGLWDVVAMNIVAVVGPAVDCAQRARRRAVGHPLAARMGGVFHPARGCAHRAVEPPS